jgi:endonuclease/exonuclease/phosphatase family metal-dependent hydrolase
MKKFLFIFVLLLLLIAFVFYYYKRTEEPYKTIPQIIRIASWNIRIFSNESRDDSELKRICQTLLDYDLVAIIELRDEEILQRARKMLETMGRNYDYQVSGEIGRNVKERYAFLYDKSMVQALDPGLIYPDPEDVFIREPYYATFVSGKFDFTIIATHVIWGSRVAQRRAEIQNLADVYNQIQQMNSSEQDVILMGDFNREPDDIKSYTQLRNIPSMISLFDLPQKSHIKDSSLYDNIWFQSDYLREYTGVSGIDKFDETDFGDNDELASLEVSDHRPVWAEFHTTMDDD